MRLPVCTRCWISALISVSPHAKPATSLPVRDVPVKWSSGVTPPYGCWRFAIHMQKGPTYGSSMWSASRKSVEHPKNGLLLAWHWVSLHQLLAKVPRLSKTETKHIQTDFCQTQSTGEWWYRAVAPPFFHGLNCGLKSSCRQLKQFKNFCWPVMKTDNIFLK